jgi:hypothetical protein
VSKGKEKCASKQTHLERETLVDVKAQGEKGEEGCIVSGTVYVRPKYLLENRKTGGTERKETR